MLASARAGLIAALFAISFAISCVVPAAAQKAFVRDDLNEASIKLEAQIKTEAGQVRQTGSRTSAAKPTPPSRATIRAPA